MGHITQRDALEISSPGKRRSKSVLKECLQILLEKLTGGSEEMTSRRHCGRKKITFSPRLVRINCRESGEERWSVCYFHSNDEEYCCFALPSLFMNYSETRLSAQSKQFTSVGESVKRDLQLN